MKGAVVLLCLALTAGCEEDPAKQLLTVKRIFVDRLNGGETAAQLRDMIINALQKTGLFVITEREDRADAVLRGSGEDLVYTDTYLSSEGMHARTRIGTGSYSRSRAQPNVSLSAGEQESIRIAERKHEAVASVRLVSKDGDVIWATTQESKGAKFRGASADVAEKITRQLLADIEKLRGERAPKAP